MTSRDIEILMAIYRVKFLTIPQLIELFFSEKPSYAYRRLHMLKTAGYLLSKPLIDPDSKGRKKTTCYYLTEKALKELEIEASTPVSRLMMGHQNYRALVNDIFVMIYKSKLPWIWLDSREIKREFRLNRSSEIAGAIKIVDDLGKKTSIYAVYLLPKNTSEQKIYQIKYEINRNTYYGLTQLIVLCQSHELYRQFGNEHLKTTKLHKLPFGFGKQLLSALGPRFENIREIADEVLGSLPFKGMVTPYSDQEIYYEGYKYQFVELLSGDLVKLHFIKEYGKQLYEENRTRILVLVFDVFYQELKDLFNGKEYVQLVLVPHKIIDNLPKREEIL